MLRTQMGSQAETTIIEYDASDNQSKVLAKDKYWSTSRKKNLCTHRTQTDTDSAYIRLFHRSGGSKASWHRTATSVSSVLLDELENGILV